VKKAKKTLQVDLLYLKIKKAFERIFTLPFLATSPVSTKSSSPLHARSPVDIKPSPIKTPAVPTIQYAQAAAAHAQRMRTDSGTASTQSIHDRSDDGKNWEQ
jgi:hypothetical protein